MGHLLEPRTILDQEQSLRLDPNSSYSWVRQCVQFQDGPSLLTGRSERVLRCRRMVKRVKRACSVLEYHCLF